ncbi:MAG TPA: helix-turn-helix domain-containing protein, partial [Candidatus Omnitrophota bacterium]|nr:helix-turn-helix domain-containing protein [Candidatus Omnitrophota bacterium]
MGVIYKLKQEVIDYILHIKKENNDFSCRQIAKIASDKFDVDISKSSVNTILKNSQLSSGVGRRVIQKKDSSRKFQIPQERKEQFQETMKQFGFEKENVVAIEEPIAVPLLPDAVKENLFLEPKSDDIMLLESQAPTLLVSQEQHLSLTDQTDSKLIEEIDFLRQQKQQAFSKVYTNAGVILLKALLLLTDGIGFLLKIIKKYNPEHIFPDNFEESLNIFLLLKALGIKDPFEEDISSYAAGLLGLQKSDSAYVGQALASEDSRKIFFQWSKKIRLSDDLLKEYRKEKNNLFLSVYGFRIELEDKTVLLTDASLKSFYKEMDCIFPLPFYHAIRLLSQYFIVNEKPMVFDFSGNSLLYLPQIAKMFDNVKEKRVQKIFILNDHLQDICELSVIPQKKRQWIARVDFSFFEGMEKTVSAGSRKKVFYDALSDEIYDFSEFLCQLDHNQNVRAFIIENKSCERLATVFSNCFEMESEAVVSSFFMRFIFKNSFVKEKVSVTGFLKNNENAIIENFSDLADDFLKTFANYFTQYFLSDKNKDNSSAWNEFLKLKGSFDETKQFLHALFYLDEKSPFKNDCIMAMRIFNEYLILDDKQRRIFLDIAKI